MPTYTFSITDSKHAAQNDSEYLDRNNKLLSQSKAATQALTEVTGKGISQSSGHVQILKSQNTHTVSTSNQLTGVQSGNLIYNNWDDPRNNQSGFTLSSSSFIFKRFGFLIIGDSLKAKQSWIVTKNGVDVTNPDNSYSQP